MSDVATYRPTSDPHRQRDILLLAALVIMLTVLGALGFAAREVGSIDISVREHGGDGADIAFSVPAAMVHSAIQLVPAQLYREIGPEVAEFMPLIRAAHEELADLPDCVLVSVRSDRERVKIAKERNRLIIDVQTEDEDVRIALPLSTVGAAVAKLGWAASSRS